MPQVVHAVVAEAAAAHLDLAGLAAVVPTVATVAHGDVAAVVSHTPDLELLPTRANLVGHTRMVEVLRADTCAVPMRFGVVVPDERTVVDELLTPRADALRRTLTWLEGHDELRLRGVYRETELIRQLLATDPRARRLQGRTEVDAQLELGERISAGLDRVRERDLEHVMTSLRHEARAVAVNAVRDPFGAVDVSFLVAADRVEAFAVAVDEIAEELAAPVDLDLVGPLPPFSFADPEEVGAWVS